MLLPRVIKVRPAFMDEYEKLEEELKALYEDYIIKFRCVAFLEQQVSETQDWSSHANAANRSKVEEFERVEQERMEERKLATKKILERMKQEDNMRSFEGEKTTSADCFDEV